MLQHDFGGAVGECSTKTQEVRIRFPHLLSYVSLRGFNRASLMEGTIFKIWRLWVWIPGTHSLIFLFQKFAIMRIICQNDGSSNIVRIDTLGLVIFDVISHVFPVDKVD